MRKPFLCLLMLTVFGIQLANASPVEVVTCNNCNTAQSQAEAITMVPPPGSRRIVVVDLYRGSFKTYVTTVYEDFELGGIMTSVTIANSNNAEIAAANQLISDMQNVVVFGDPATAQSVNPVPVDFADLETYIQNRGAGNQALLRAYLRDYYGLDPNAPSQRRAEAEDRLWQHVGLDGLTIKLQLNDGSVISVVISRVNLERTYGSLGQVELVAVLFEAADGTVIPFTINEAGAFTSLVINGDDSAQQVADAFRALGIPVAGDPGSSAPPPNALPSDNQWFMTCSGSIAQNTFRCTVQRVQESE